jgi:hypothetical protein
LVLIFPIQYDDGYKFVAKDTCTPMFIATLFTIANYGNSPHVLQLMKGLRNCRILFS